MLPSKWKSDIGFWETLFSHTFPLKNSRYFRQLSVLLSEMIPLLLTTSIYFSSSQRKQYICWNVTNKQASRWFERIVATIASNELLNFDILECTFMSVRCFANETLDIFGMIPWVSFLFFFFITCEKQESNYQQKTANHLVNIVLSWNASHNSAGYQLRKSYFQWSMILVENFYG